MEIGPGGLASRGGVTIPAEQPNVASPRGEPPSRAWPIGLALVLALAATLRLSAIGGVGNDFLTYQIDEHRNVLLPLHLSWDNLRPRAPGYSAAYDYPALLWYTLFVLDRLAFRVGGLYGLAPREWEAWREAFEHNPIPFFLLGRTLSAAFGTATVGLVYLLGRRAFSPSHGLLAAGFLSVAFLHVRDSALATLDAPVTFWTTLSLLGVMAVLQHGGRGGYLLAGTAAGLATATKYTAVLVLVALLVAHGIRTRHASASLRAALAAPRLWVALIAAAVVFAAVNPYLLLDWSKALRDLAWLAGRVQSGQYRDIGPAWWYHLTVSLRYGLGLGLLGLAMAGIAGSLFRREPAGVVLASFALVFFAVIGSARLIFVRYVEPLLPVMCLFAAVAVMALSTHTRRVSLRRWVVAAVGVVVCIEPLFGAVTYGRIMDRADTRVHAFRFIQRTLPPRTVIASYGPSVTWRSTVPRFHPRLYAKPPEQSWAEALATLKADGVLYFLTHHSELDTFSPRIPELEQAVRTSATLIQEFRFSDTADPRPIYDVTDPFHLPIGGFRGVKRPGPLVRLYRLS